MDEGELFFEPDRGLLLAGISIRIHLNIILIYLTTIIFIVIMMTRFETMTTSSLLAFFERRTGDNSLILMCPSQSSSETIHSRVR